MSLRSKREFVAKVTPRAFGYVGRIIVGTGFTGFLLVFVKPPEIEASGTAVIAGVVLELIAAAVEVVVTSPSFKKMESLAGALLKSGQQAPSRGVARQEKKVCWAR